MTATEVAGILLLQFAKKRQAPQTSKQVLAMYTSNIKSNNALMDMASEIMSNNQHDFDSSVTELARLPAIQETLYSLGANSTLFDHVVKCDISEFRGCLAFSVPCTCTPEGCKAVLRRATDQSHSEQPATPTTPQQADHYDAQDSGDCYQFPSKAQFACDQHQQPNTAPTAETSAVQWNTTGTTWTAIHHQATQPCNGSDLHVHPTVPYANIELPYDVQYQANPVAIGYESHWDTTGPEHPRAVQNQANPVAMCQESHWDTTAPAHPDVIIQDLHSVPHHYEDTDWDQSLQIASTVLNDDISDFLDTLTPRAPPQATSLQPPTCTTLSATSRSSSDILKQSLFHCNIDLSCESSAITESSNHNEVDMVTWDSVCGAELSDEEVESKDTRILDEAYTDSDYSDISSVSSGDSDYDDDNECNSHTYTGTLDNIESDVSSDESDNECHSQTYPHTLGPIESDVSDTDSDSEMM